MCDIHKERHEINHEYCDGVQKAFIRFQVAIVLVTFFNYSLFFGDTFFHDATTLINQSFWKASSQLKLFAEYEVIFASR